MDSRAKQRLTGAIILVALFVLLVPELLTGPKNAAKAPAQEEGLRSYTIDLDAPAAPAGVQPTGPAVALPPVVEAPAGAGHELAQPGESAAPDSSPTPVAADSQAKPPAASGPVPKPAQASSAPVASTAPAVRPAPATTPVETSREAPRQPKEPQTAASGGKGRFVVQLGSFGSRDNAERLVREMTSKGFATFVAPITTNGRELYRVRVGPTRDRASAEALATQLKRMGQSGSIVPIP
jgi:DedD protein